MNLLLKMSTRTSFLLPRKLFPEKEKKKKSYCIHKRFLVLLKIVKKSYLLDNIIYLNKLINIIDYLDSFRF